MNKKVRSLGAAPAITAERLSVLREAADHAGAEWAKRCRAALHGERRAAAGGWPGTMSEARSVMVAFFAQRSRSSLTHEELSWAARTAYARARHDWLASVEHDDGD